MRPPASLQRLSFSTSDDMVDCAADLIARRANDYVTRNGVFRFVLSGGTSPIPLYKRLGHSTNPPSIPWEQTEIFWGDERMVDPGSERSNYGMAASIFLNKVRLGPKNIHRMHGESENPELAAQNYEYTIAGSFGLPAFPAAWDQSGPLVFPRFDLVLLGMGPDGHTASIFPGAPALHTRRWVLPVPSPEIPPRIPRLTMTAPLLSAAKTVIFLVMAKGKHSALERVHTPDYRSLLPAGNIAAEKELFWLVVR
ncbi:6-phosphogluconolactonase [Desulfoplanes sp.]